MGGCVASIMSSSNASKMVPHADITNARANPVQAVPVGAASDTASPIYRGSIGPAVPTDEEAFQALCKQYYSGSNLVAKLRQTVKTFGNANATAHRPIERFEKGEIEENGKKKPWEFIHLKPTVYTTYNQLWRMMAAFGVGLNDLGFGAGTRVGIYEETRLEWLVSCYGLWTQSMTGVTVYANLGEDALEYAIKEAELPLIICNGKGVKTLVSLLSRAGGSAGAPTIVYIDDLPAGLDVGSLTVVAWKDVLARGEAKLAAAEAGAGADADAAAKEAAADALLKIPADNDEVALIMYTSGTTGDPKGVVLSHGTVHAGVSALTERLLAVIGPKQDGETYIGYLPLAHIMEFACENIFINRGTLLCYGNPRTLTNTSARPHGDLQEFKPMLVVGVPRIFDTIKKAVESKLPPPGTLKRRVFDQAYADRKQALLEGKDTPYWNEKVFAGPREIFGGRVRAMISGGAPLSAQLQEFMNVVFGGPMLQGWGLTETCSCGTTQRKGDMVVAENIGGLVPTCEIKLLDVDDWKHTDPEPRGEVLIRGPFVAKGYFKQAEMTAKAFDAEGWFHTGDVGLVKPDGTLKIIGRVKALAKNAFGEYVALDALESTYVINPLVMPNGVCVLVDSTKPYIAALVLTDEAKATAFAKANGIEGAWPALLSNPEFHVKAAASLVATAKAAGKKPFECVKYVRVLSDEWTPENGVLTAAQKLKRRVIDVKYADLIKELFKTDA